MERFKYPKGYTGLVCLIDGYHDYTLCGQSLYSAHVGHAKFSARGISKARVCRACMRVRDSLKLPVWQSHKPPVKRQVKALWQSHKPYKRG